MRLAVHLLIHFLMLSPTPADAGPQGIGLGDGSPQDPAIGHRQFGARCARVVQVMREFVISTRRFGGNLVPLQRYLTAESPHAVRHSSTLSEGEFSHLDLVQLRRCFRRTV